MMLSTTTKVQRTYGSRISRATKPFIAPPSSPASTLASSPPATPALTRPSKRSLEDVVRGENIAPLFPAAKRTKTLAKPSLTKPKLKTQSKDKRQQKTLTQLHFNIDQTILRTCSLCNLSYTKGAPDDESLHKAHCVRVRQGMEWGREEEKDRIKYSKDIVTEVAADVKLKEGKKKGRILCIAADISGKIGTKLSTLFQTINLSLSAPDLPASSLQGSKVYIFLVPHESQPSRERIVGCVIAQRINTAMEVISAPASSTSSPEDSSGPITVDSETNLYCSPELLPCHMGIPRLFVSSSHRRMGIASALLDSACATFIHEYPLDKSMGEVAFSQPTGMGQLVMKKWGQGKVRGVRGIDCFP